MTTKKRRCAWGPIESAPKSQRLLVWSGQEMYCARWAQNIETGHEAWVIAEWGDEGDCLMVTPSHWMALPAPPQEQEIET